MPENRFYLDTPFQKGASKLDGEEFKHLKVMRGEEGDTIELVNGRNQLAQAKITQVEKHQALLELIKVTDHPPPKRQIILAQAYLRPKNLDLVIEKGTELGATAFWLFTGERSEKDSLSDNQLHRLESITISALKQCGRLDLPQIVQLPPLAKWKEKPPGKLYFGDPRSTQHFAPASDITIFIGPEKGFSSKEESFLQKTLHVQGIRLNPNILRAETAAICALSLINY